MNFFNININNSAVGRIWIDLAGQIVIFTLFFFIVEFLFNKKIEKKN